MGIVRVPGLLVFAWEDLSSLVTSQWRVCCGEYAAVVVTDCGDSLLAQVGKRGIDDRSGM